MAKEITLFYTTEIILSGDVCYPFSEFFHSIFFRCPRVTYIKFTIETPSVVLVIITVYKWRYHCCPYRNYSLQSSGRCPVYEKVSVNCNLCGKLISDLDPDAINDLVTCVTCEDSTLSLMIDGNETKVISPRQYHCSKCPKHFVRKERLEFHEMRHNENMNEFISIRKVGARAAS